MIRLEQSIDTIDLSARANHALHKNKIHTIEDMLTLDEAQLYQIRNIGKKTVDEIVNVIAYCKDQIAKPDQIVEEGVLSFEDWINSDQGKQEVTTFLEKGQYGIKDMAGLSNYAYNTLLLNGYTRVAQIFALSEAELFEIPHMNTSTATEIRSKLNTFLSDNKNLFYFPNEGRQEEDLNDLNIEAIVRSKQFRSDIIRFVRANDVSIDEMNLSNGAYNQLKNNNLASLSDIIFFTKEDLLLLKSMGTKKAEDILHYIREYLEKNEFRIKSFLLGDENSLIDDETIRAAILHLYDNNGFGGYNFTEFKQALQLPENVDDDRLKHIIGSLLAEGELEYVDFRCFRVYKKFLDSVFECPEIDQRTKDVYQALLDGKTLEETAKQYDVTRERIRQIANNNIDKVKRWYITEKGKKWFDEDYYRYFFETYAIDKNEATAFLGIQPYVFNYLEMTGSKNGAKKLEEALEDVKGLDAGLRLKIKTYLNRNRLLIDGHWINKKRSELEEACIKERCTNDVAYSDFGEIYNQFLVDHEIDFDEDIYYSEKVKGTRKNRLSEARFLLWKQNSRFRYYDIDGRDYTELYETLHLEDYDNIELSTMKWFEDYPDLMSKYDLHDHYELHNLLRKTLPEEQYPKLVFGKMPNISFGNFDRNNAILELLLEHAPITQNDFADLIHQEYGYDQLTIIGTYLTPLGKYYHDGVYDFEQKKMSSERFMRMKEALQDDFYYMSEIRQKYLELFPEGDLEEINSYNLKELGFIILSNSVIQHYSSANRYFESLFTSNERTDISAYRRRFTYEQMFSQKFMELKRNLTIVEYDRNQIITFRKLEEAGVTKDDVYDFCQQIYDFVPENSYFSIHSIQQDGFESDLFDLGFSDMFYSSLLLSDDRFSSGTMFANTIFYKGKKNIMIRTFLSKLIQEAESIDVLDMIQILNEQYGCNVSYKYDIIPKVAGTEIYYDSTLERFYADKELYYQELETYRG